METDEGPGCVQPDGDSAVLLAGFRTWLDRERGLSPVSVRCYSKQSKAFLAGIGGAGVVSGLDAGRVTAFMVGWTQGRNTWSAKAMVTSLRAFLRFSPVLRAPRRYQQRTTGRGRAVSTRPELHDRHNRPSYPRVPSRGATSCRNGRCVRCRGVNTTHFMQAAGVPAGCHRWGSRRVIDSSGLSTCAL